MFAKLKNLFGRGPTSEDLSPRQREGRDAEDEGRRFLEARGYRCLAANHRTRYGEVDIIMEDGDTIVFVEVKARGRTDYGRPEEFVSPAKQAKIAKAALSYVKAHRLAKKPLRFDVLAFSPGGVEHLQNAFAPPAWKYYL